jgi:FKBP-type peptidyl-prolyl cis-trans isomerase
MLLRTLSLFLLLFSTCLHAAPLMGDTLTIEKYLAQKNIQATRNKEGIYIATQTLGTGAKPQAGDYIKVRYVGKLLNEKTFDQSPKDEPFVFQVGYRQVIQGWDVTFPQMTVGTKATIFIPPTLAYGASGAGDAIPPDAALMFEVELLGILSPSDYDAYMKSLEEKERQVFEQQQQTQFEKDKQLIADYAVAKKMKIQRTASGLAFVVIKEGKGAKAKRGDQVTVHYEGTLIDDKKFDSTKGRDPFSFTLGKGKVIAGWDEGLTLFSAGAEGYLLIPSRLGYKATPLDDGKTAIPANSVLIFKIQVLSVQPL